MLKQEKGRLLTWLAGIYLVLMLVMVPILAEAQTPAKELKVGLITSLTGPGSFWGITLVRGIESGFQEINNAGAVVVAGTKYNIKLIVEDDKYSPEETVKAANRLIFTEKVQFILGSTGSPPILALGAVCEQNKVFNLGAAGYTPELTKPGKNLYTVRAQGFIPKLLFGAMVNKFKEIYPNVKTLASIGPDDATGHSIYDTAMPYFKSAQFQMIEEVFYPRETKEQRAVVMRALAKKPDSLWQFSPPPEHIILQVREARFQGFKGPIWCTGTISPGYLIEGVGAESAEGFVSAWDDPVGDNSPPKLKTFASQFIAKYGEKAWDPTVEMGYSWTYMLKKGLELAGSIDPTAVRDQFLKEGIEWPSLYGPAFIKDRELLRPIIFATIKNGKPTNFSPAYPPGYPSVRK